VTAVNTDELKIVLWITESPVRRCRSGVGADISVAIKTPEFYTVVFPQVGFFTSEVFGQFGKGYVGEL